MSLPVITFILGNPNYIYLTLNQASKFCEEVVLFGDETNFNKHKGINHVNVNELTNNKIELLKKTYTHRSTNPYSFDINCLLRWFYMEEYMKANNIELAVHMDPDVLVYEDVGVSLHRLYKNDEVAYTIMERDYEYDWNCMGSMSYWKLNALEKFTNLILDYYQNKQEELDILAKKFFLVKPFGGISDMTFLTLFFRENLNLVKNIALVHENKYTYDSYMRTQQNFKQKEYRASERSGILMKDIVIKNNIPIGYNIIENREINFKSLHFQGHTKELMIYYFIGKISLFKKLEFIGKAIFFMIKKKIKKLLIKNNGYKKQA